MKQPKVVPPLFSTPDLLKLSQVNQDKLKGLDDYKGLKFWLPYDNNERLSWVDENHKTYLRKQVTSLVSTLGGLLRLNYENDCFIIVNLTDSKHRKSFD